jgi:replicative DNA helicase
MNAHPSDIHKGKRKQDEFTEEERALHFGHAEEVQEVPCNIMAEQALLGAILMNNEALDALRVPIEPEHFFEPVHRQIFDAAVDLRRAGRVANPVTVKNFVTDGMVGDITMAQYLAKLVQAAVSVLNAPDYARAIIETAARRACIALSQKMEQTAYSKELDIMDEFDALRAKFEAVSRALSGEEKTKTLAEASRRSLATTALAYQGKGLSGVDYGVPFLMQMIGPLLPGQEIIIGGMTKHGKSSLIEQIVAGAAINGHPVWINSGEMKDEELARRALARLTDIKAWQQVRGKVSDHDYERLETARRNAETWQDRVFIRDDTMTLRQIERDLAEFSKRNPGGMGVVDHVGLVEKDSNHARTNDAEFSSIVTRKLKVFAGNNKIPIVAAAQLKKNIFEITDRTINRKTFMKVIGRRPKAADLFGSCEKDADHVITPFRAEAVMDENEPAEIDDLHIVWEEVMGDVRNKAEIVLALSRHTRWPQRKSVGWDGPRTMFTELHQNNQGSFL